MSGNDTLRHFKVHHASAWLVKQHGEKWDGVGTSWRMLHSRSKIVAGSKRVWRMALITYRTWLW